MAAFSRGDNLRKRSVLKSKDLKQPKPEDFFLEKGIKESTELRAGTYWLTRILFLRSLGFIYVVAFLVAAQQNKQLLGRNGLLPADKFLDQIEDHAGGVNLQAATHVPSLLWLVDRKRIDLFLDVFAYAGLAIAAVVTITGAANVIAMFSLWILYHSIVNVGQRWYSFGWESQLLETGFLAIFFCPLLRWQKLPKDTPPSWVVLWGYRWLLFRIMLGAGLIKIRGDRCWRNLTCMNYHYETQPVPSPVSYYLHQMPQFVHKCETFANHIVELIVPWFTFLTRRFRLGCGILQIFFQVVLIISGNLSFLNWLTILPSICFFDDLSLGWLFPSGRGGLKSQVCLLQLEEQMGKMKTGKPRRITNLSLALALTYLSIPVVINLLSPNQQMNTSFEPLRIVNTYGAFGSITKERPEVIFQGSYSNDPTDPTAVWEEYEFKCKPGNVSQAPCLITPYHYRLDWLMWFAAFQNYQYNPWLVHLAGKFLVNDAGTTSLIKFNPFEGKAPPKFVRAEHYRYSFTNIGSKGWLKGHWWKRRIIGNYMPPVSLTSLQPILKKFGWTVSK